METSWKELYIFTQSLNRDVVAFWKIHPTLKFVEVQQGSLV